MKYLAYIALFSFIAIGIFGFAGLLSLDSGFMDCAKALSGSSTACSGSFEAGLVHVRIYQGFSQALLAALIFLSAVFLSTFLARQASADPTQIFETVSGIAPSNYQQRLFCWITLHEKADPIV